MVGMRTNRWGLGLLLLVWATGLPAGAQEGAPQESSRIEAGSREENTEGSIEENTERNTEEDSLGNAEDNGGLSVQAPAPQEQATAPSLLYPAPPPLLSDLDLPATTVTEWLAQIAADLIEITAVRLETTETGLSIVLETNGESLEIPVANPVGNALIADIPNATIAENFEQAKPIAGIARVEVTGLPGDRVRVAITGIDAPPVAEITAADQGLAFAITAGTATVGEEEAIELVVTGEQDEGYNPSRASTATRTDTPLRDVPASIQVVPRQVLEDRNVQNLNQAVETVSSVVDSGRNNANINTGGRIIRGFVGLEQEGTLRNGLRDSSVFSLTGIGTIEQVEVLKGPASVLFGALSPGGTVNVITRQPLR